jgi:hypothetical protein
MTDVLNTLAGIGPGSSLLALREERPQSTTHAERSSEGEHEPVGPGEEPTGVAAVVAL